MIAEHEIFGKETLVVYLNLNAKRIQSFPYFRDIPVQLWKSVVFVN